MTDIFQIILFPHSYRHPKGGGYLWVVCFSMAAIVFWAAGRSPKPFSIRVHPNPIHRGQAPYYPRKSSCWESHHFETVARDSPVARAQLRWDPSGFADRHCWTISLLGYLLFLDPGRLPGFKTTIFFGFSKSIRLSRNDIKKHLPCYYNYIIDGLKIVLKLGHFQCDLGKIISHWTHDFQN